MSTQYHFHSKLVVRTPSLPFEPQNLNEHSIKALLDETWFKEAIYLASPDLYDIAMSWLQGATIEERKQKKMVVSLAKYYSRMMSRCTPFGLFASCSMLKWGKESESKVLFNDENKHRHTRFDMHFLCALAQKIAEIPVIKEYLNYFPNSSIYYLGDEIRYIEYRYINAQRSHQISAVTVSEYLERVIEKSKSGTTYAELVACLIDEEITKEDATVFIEELIASQLLVNDLEPAITGEEFIEQIIKAVRDVYQKTNDVSVKNLIEYLLKINQAIKDIDASGLNDVAAYRHLLEKIREFGVLFEENKLFQTDLFRTTSDEVINQQYQDKLSKAFEVLNRITPKRENNNLSSFARRFYERYEDNEMPLLEVLDTETGIGYLENSSADINPLIDGVVLPQNNDGNYSVEWGKVQNWLFEKLTDAHRQGKYELELTDDDFKAFDAPSYDDLPPSMSVMFKIIDNENAEKGILLEGISGSSGINLLGRFAHGDAEILKTTREIAELEQANNSDVVFAEVIHLPESRVGNILLHPTFRAYEIPYLAKSSLPIENQITVDDLYVSVKFNKIVLRSKRLNKVVVPRLSTAHNYSYRALPVYQFLCDLQTQNLRFGFMFHWGNLAHQYKFLPRVSTHGVVIHAATWQLKKEDFAFLSASFSEMDLKTFIEKWNFPQYVVLADGDNELFLDWQNELSIKVFVDAIKNRTSIILKEFLYEKTPTIGGHDNTSFINQNIALLIRNNTLYKTQSITSPAIQTKRNFSVGSEWLYFKLYCGSKVADKILTESIKPLTETLLENNLIDKWFFIRYSDPQLHLRLRLHLVDKTKIGDVIRCLQSFISKAEEAGYIWKTQIDTYNRELERYGFENIVHAETFFYEDSKAIVEMLDQTWGDERENIRWIWGIRAIDDIFNTLQFPLADRLSLMEVLKENFAQEFKVDVLFKQQMDKKYRENRGIINQILDREKDLTSEIYPLLKILDNKKTVLSDTFNALQLLANENRLNVSLRELLSSYIHMLINRLIPSNQRLHELFIYDFMYRTYESTAARAKKSLILTKA